MKIKYLLIAFIFSNTINVNSQTDTIADYNFDNYTSGDKIAEVGGASWTTISAQPGSAEDATISNAQSTTIPNSLLVSTDNMSVLKLGEQTAGNYCIKFKVRIASENYARVNILQKFDGADSQKGLSIGFKKDKIAWIITKTDEETTEVAFEPDKWLQVSIFIDLDNDMATLLINDKKIKNWQWSFGQAELKSLEAINFDGWNGTKFAWNSKFFIDDLLVYKTAQLPAPENVIAELDAENTGCILKWQWYNALIPKYYIIYRNNIIVDTLIYSKQFHDKKLYPDTYQYKVMAFFDNLGTSKLVQSNQVNIAGSIDREYVLFEIGTGTTCTYCTGAAMGVADLLANNKKVAIIKYHTYSKADPFYNGVGLVRANLYNMGNVYPNTICDGKLANKGGSYQVSMYPTFLKSYNKRIIKPSLYKLDLKIIHISETGYKAVVTVEQKSDYLQNPVRLYVALTESHAQYNWGNQTEVNERCIGMFPSEKGTTLSFNNQQIITKEIPFELRLNPDLTIADYELVVFVQENQTNEVIQTTKLNMENCLGLKNINSRQITIYPNPTNNYFYIKTEKSANAQIIDINGRLIRTEKLKSDINKINIKDLNTGVYFIKIISDQTSFIEKLIIN